MLQPRAAEDLLPFSVEREIGVIPYSPLAKGLLTGKFNVGDTLSGIRANDPEFLGARFEHNLRIVAALKDVAAGYEKTVAQLAINWTATFPGVTSPLVGAKRPSQVAENVAAVGWTITPEDRVRIDEIIKGSAGDA